MSPTSSFMHKHSAGRVIGEGKFIFTVVLPHQETIMNIKELMKMETLKMELDE